MSRIPTSHARDKPARSSLVLRGGTLLAVLGSLDWIAWLSLRGADPALRATIISALTGLALVLSRASTRLLSLHIGDASGSQDET